MTNLSNKTMCLSVNQSKLILCKYQSQKYSRSWHYNVLLR